MREVQQFWWIQLHLPVWVPVCVGDFLQGCFHQHRLCSSALVLSLPFSSVPHQVGADAPPRFFSTAGCPEPLGILAAATLWAADFAVEAPGNAIMTAAFPCTFLILLMVAPRLTFKSQTSRPA